MRVKFHPSLPLLLFGLSVACGEPDEPTDDQLGPSLQGDAATPDAGGFLPPAGGFDAGGLPPGSGSIDAGGTPALDATIPPLEAGAVIDAGSMMMGSDGGGGPLPGTDAGSMVGSDAGRDASAGSDGGASGCSLTYENFGRQFMTMYCARCHTGLFAGHGVQLDTLAGVQTNKAAIKTQAVTGTAMPQADPKPTSAERQQLGQWLDCGPN